MKLSANGHFQKPAHICFSLTLLKILMQEKNTQTSGGNSEHKRSATECFSTLKERVISKTKRLCH